MPVLTIVGGQYGSEGKGRIAQAVASGCHIAIRTGGPNAGHTIIHEGQTWKMRSVPCAWVNPECALVIGPGAVIDPDILRKEVSELEAVGYRIRDRLWIDERATIIVPDDLQTERGTFAEREDLVHRIGSTGKGVGAARARKTMRIVDEWVTAEEALPTFHVVDTVHLFAGLHDRMDRVTVLEGTQGFGLSVTYGPWPFVTSTDLTPTQMLNDAGIPQPEYAHTLMVLRTYPIRVAGNSGPLRNELSWDEMSARLGKQVIEYTTVTNKPRRIGEFDWEQVREAVRICQPDSIALTFADYIDPSIEGVCDWDKLSRPVLSFIDQLESKYGVPVVMVGTGGDEVAVAINPDPAYPPLYSRYPGSR